MTQSITTKREAISAGQNAVRSYNDQIREFDSEISITHDQIRDLENKASTQIENILYAVLPEADDTTVNQAAEELGCFTLLQEKRQLIDEIASLERKITAIEQSQEFQEIDLNIHPLTGTLVVAYEETQVNIDAVEASKKRFESNLLFREAYAQRNDPPPTGLVALWKRFIYLFIEDPKIVAERDFYEERNLTFEEAFEEYHNDCSAIEKFSREMKATQQQIAHLQNLKKKHAELVSLVGSKKANILKNLQTRVITFLSSLQDLKPLHKQIRKPLRPSVSTIMALRDQTKYLRDILQFLQKERNALQKKRSGIETNLAKWKRNSSGRLKGNKADWLVNLPAQKAASTSKKLTHIRTMRTNVYSYERYEVYDYFVEKETVFLPFDLFARCGETRMPYDNFCFSVLPEIQDYRNDNDAVDGAALAAVMAGVDFSHDAWDPADVVGNDYADSSISEFPEETFDEDNSSDNNDDSEDSLSDES